jgi:hypothetical protein
MITFPRPGLPDTNAIMFGALITKPVIFAVPLTRASIVTEDGALYEFGSIALYCEEDRLVAAIPHTTMHLAPVWSEDYSALTYLAVDERRVTLCSGPSQLRGYAPDTILAGNLASNIAGLRRQSTSRRHPTVSTTPSRPVNLLHDEPTPDLTYSPGAHVATSTYRDPFSRGEGRTLMYSPVHRVATSTFRDTDSATEQHAPPPSRSNLATSTTGLRSGMSTIEALQRRGAWNQPAALDSTVAAAATRSPTPEAAIPTRNMPAPVVDVDPVTSQEQVRRPSTPASMRLPVAPSASAESAVDAPATSLGKSVSFKAPPKVPSASMNSVSKPASAPKVPGKVPTKLPNKGAPGSPASPTTDVQRPRSTSIAPQPQLSKVVPVSTAAAADPQQPASSASQPHTRVGSHFNTSTSVVVPMVKAPPKRPASVPVGGPTPAGAPAAAAPKKVFPKLPR